MSKSFIHYFCTYNLELIKDHKLYKYLVFSVKLIIFSLALYYIYLEFSHKSLDKIGPFIFDHISSSNALFGITAILLLQFVNYALENQKWRTILEDIKSYSFIETQKAVYAGNAIAILTPDRLGTFIGRFSYLKNVSKSKITLSTFVGNYAQLTATIVFSLIGMILAWNLKIDFQLPEKVTITTSIVILVMICSSTLFIYYQQKIILELLKKSNRNFIKRVIPKFEFMERLNEMKLHIILGLAFLRYLVFVFQFFIALIIFEPSIDFYFTLAFCGILYLFATLIPSPFMGNLGTREAIAIFLMANLGFQEAAISASLLIWLINVVFPSILGGIILLKR